MMHWLGLAASMIGKLRATLCVGTLKRPSVLSSQEHGSLTLGRLIESAYVIGVAVGVIQSWSHPSPQGWRLRL